MEKKQKLKFQPWTLVDVINVHSRLSSDFPETPYVTWCRWVHNSKLTPVEKFSRLRSWSINPADYTSPTLFAYDYQLFKLLGKYRETDSLSDSQIRSALEAFNAAEEKCGRVNEYWFQHGKMPVNDTILYRARKTVERVLGDISLLYRHFDESDIVEIDQFQNRYVGSLGTLFSETLFHRGASSRFGPGVSMGKGGTITSLGEKVVCGTTTPEHLGVAGWWQRRGHYGSFTLIQGDLLCFVPKNVDTGRAVLPGPSMNMRSQLLAGDYVRDRLKAVLNINLRDQTRNQSLAKLGSLTDSYCTLDLKGASDSISYSIVCDLLPQDWLAFFDTLRSPRFFDESIKEWREYAKFSAMGNGFTFELETLIFYAIMEAAIFVANGSEPISRDELAVYGDDMIFPKEYYTVVSQSLVGCGFSVNATKSFSAGPFRESCGADYFKGWLVTPYKLEVINEITDAVNFHNGLFEIACRINSASDPCPRFRRALSFIRRRLQRDCDRLSFGKPEKLWCPTTLRWVGSSSGRFLWSDNPWAEPNTFYSTSYQSIQPKYFLLLEDEVRYAYDKKLGKRIPSRYDVHIDVARYLCTYGGKTPGVQRLSPVIRRNRCDDSVSRQLKALIRGRVGVST